MPFANSTHAKHWIFTPQDLEAIRLKCDSATRSRLRGDVDYITLQEQSIFINFYLLFFFIYFVLFFFFIYVVKYIF